MADEEQDDIDAATAEINATNGVVPSVLALIDNFVATIEAAGSDRAALKQAVSDMKTHREALAAAVAANPLPESPPA